MYKNLRGIIGLQWGDEGKAKVVMCSSECDVVAHFQGRPIRTCTLQLKGKYVCVPFRLEYSEQVRLINRWVLTALFGKLRSLGVRCWNAHFQASFCRLHHLVLPAKPKPV